MKDVTEIIQQRMIIPTCSYCGKFRDDNNCWQEVDKYLEKLKNVQFSHGICSGCAKKHYPDYDLNDD